MIKKLSIIPCLLTLWKYENEVKSSIPPQEIADSKTCKYIDLANHWKT